MEGCHASCQPSDASIPKTNVYLEVNFVDGLDQPQQPISDEEHGIGEWIGQVRRRERVAACFQAVAVAATISPNVVINIAVRCAFCVCMCV